jgi:hypothetical protein
MNHLFKYIYQPFMYAQYKGQKLSHSNYYIPFEEPVVETVTGVRRPQA